MGNPFEDLRQAVVVRPMNSPGPQGAAAPHMKIKYSADGVTWHNDPVETDKYLSFSTDNGTTWSDAIYFNNLSETLEWVEKARQWAETPENDEVEPGQYSALHHALQAKKSEITAAEYAIDAAGSAAEAFGAAAPAWDSETTYNYNDVVSFDNGHTYRCIGDNVTTPPNTGGIDDEVNWTRITVSHNGFFEYDTNYDFQPVIAPVSTTGPWMLDELGDIQPRLDPDLAVSELDELISESANLAVSELAHVAEDEITLRSLIVSAGSTPMSITVYDDIPITDDLIVPENIELNFKRGGKLSVSATKTLTINGTISAGLYQIFSGDGNVSLGDGAVKVPRGQMFISPSKEVYPEWWYPGTGSYDAALIKAVATKKVVKLSKFYTITDSIPLPAYTHITGIGRNVSGLIGTLTNKSYIRPIFGETPTERQRTSIWYLSNFAIMDSEKIIREGSIGLNMRNVGYSIIENIFIDNMDIGVATSYWGIYNKFLQPRIIANTGMYLDSNSGGNSIISPQIWFKTIGIDIHSGMYDLIGGSIEGAAGSSHAIRVGRESTPGRYAEVGAYNVYVEGSDGVTCPLEIGKSANFTAVHNIRIHGNMGNIVNNGNPSHVILDTWLANRPQIKANKIYLGPGLYGFDTMLMSTGGANIDVKWLDSSGADIGYAYIRAKGIRLPGGGISATNYVANNLRGSHTMVAGHTADIVSFPVAETNSAYYIVATVSGITGTPPVEATRCWISDKTANGFTLHVEADPGVGNSVTVDWIMVR